FVRPERVESTLARPGGSASDSKLLFQSIFDQSRVVAVDCKTGKIVWSFQAAGGIFAEPTVTAEYVFVGSHDRHLYCLDKQTGRMIWKFATQGPIEAGTAFRGDSVFMASCDGSLYRLAVKTGKPLWIFRTNPARRHATAIYSAPRIIGDSVCFASAEGQLYAVQFATGQLLWKIDGRKSSDMSGAVATDGRSVFVQTRLNSTWNGVNGIAAFGEAP
ncbi:MAG: PQQ-binding-like beta-propeller repeat protein, partial [Deltaproteobacteria bacterium]